MPAPNLVIGGATLAVVILVVCLVVSSLNSNPALQCDFDDDGKIDSTRWEIDCADSRSTAESAFSILVFGIGLIFSVPALVITFVYLRNQ